MITDSQIDHIIASMECGHEVWWINEGTAMKIRLISAIIQLPALFPIALFPNGFIDLNNTEPTDIFIGNSLTGAKITGIIGG